MDDNYTIPSSVLSDLCSRFIINIPEDKRNDLIKIFFQIEIAHWFYLDFYCESINSTVSESNENLIQQPTQNQNLKPCSIRTFAENIFRHCPFLMQYSNKVDDILSKWKVFKYAVPTNGAILLDETMRYVLLVQGFWAKTSWGFPKGKVYEEETETNCAIREVFEETGYDITNQIAEDQYLQISINDQIIRLYIITNVSKNTKFEPRTRREIKEVRWFAIDELPIHRKDNRSKQILGFSPNSFFMVIPFIKGLKQWISSCSNQTNSANLSINGLNSSNNNGISKSSSNNLNNQRSQSTINHQRHNSSSHGNHHHHHHHHSHHHNGHHHNGHHNTIDNSNSFHTNGNGSFNKHHTKALSKSNENLSSIKSNNSFSFTNSNSNNKSFFNNDINSNSSNLNSLSNSLSNSSGTSQKKTSHKIKNVFLKQHTNYSNESKEKQQRMTNVKQQSQYYQKLQQNDFADFLSLKDAALANKTNKISAFNSTKTSSPYTNNNTKSKSNQNNINNVNNKNYSNQLNQNLQIQKIKKHLEFNGPECWINFKFDYDSIIQNLPPLFEL